MTHSVANGEPLVAETVDRSKAFAAWVAAAFLLAGLVILWRHEMWRDELQAWLIAKESRSIAELFHNFSYDGHPPLWYLVLYGVTRLTIDPIAMQLLHLAIATATVYIFARYAPFTRLQRALFCFGYFPAYEYATISRNYSIGLLSVFAFCAVYCAGASKRHLLLASLLALLANANAYAFMLAAAFALMLLYDFTRLPESRVLIKARTAVMIAAPLILLLAMWLSASVMLPPVDTGYTRATSLNIRFSPIEAVWPVVWNAFVPVPQFERRLWSTNAVEPQDAVVPAFLILAATALALARSRVALVAYVSGASAILLFTFARFYGSLRHHGHLYVLFVACLWIAARRPDPERLQHPFIRRLTETLGGAGQRLFTVLLVIQLIVAATLWVMDWTYPFSRSKEVAEFLRQQRLSAAYIVTDTDAHASPISAYLNRTLYFVRGDREGTYIIWDRARVPPPQDLLAAAKRKAAERRQDVVVVATYQLERDDAVRPIAQFTGSITDEDYYLYVVEPR